MAHGGTEAGVDTAPKVAADRGGMLPEPVAEEMVEFVVVKRHTYLAVVYFQQTDPGVPGGLLATGFGLSRG